MRASKNFRPHEQTFELRAFRSSEAAARKIVAIAYGLGEVWDGRLFVEKLNWAMLPKWGFSRRVECRHQMCGREGWPWRHESRSFYRLNQAGKTCALEREALRSDVTRRDSGLSLTLAASSTCSGSGAPPRWTAVSPHFFRVDVDNVELVSVDVADHQSPHVALRDVRPLSLKSSAANWVASRHPFQARQISGVPPARKECKTDAA